jgi:hypothetical protein
MPGSGWFYRTKHGPGRHPRKAIEVDRGLISVLAAIGGCLTTEHDTRLGEPFASRARLIAEPR